MTKERNIFRGTIAQVVAGLAFVLTFIQSANNFGVDFKQRTEHSTAELFAKTMTQIDENDPNKWSAVGALYVLGNLAESDPRYRPQIFSALSELILRRSVECEHGKFYGPQFELSPQLKVATRVIAMRNLDNDPSDRHNLSWACLAKGDFLKSRGLSNLYMPHVYLARGNFRGASFDKSDISHASAEIDPSKAAIEPYSNEWYTVIANFEGANFKSTNMTGVQFVGSNLRETNIWDSNLTAANLRYSDLSKALILRSDLKEADLTGANIANAKFREIKNLTVSQLLSACVRGGTAKAGEDNLQPELPRDLRQQVDKLGGIKAC